MDWITSFRILFLTLLLALCGLNNVKGKDLAVHMLSADDVYRTLHKSGQSEEIPVGRIITRGWLASSTYDELGRSSGVKESEVCFESRNARSLEEAEAVSQAYSDGVNAGRKNSNRVRHSGVSRRVKRGRRNKRKRNGSYPKNNNRSRNRDSSYDRTNIGTNSDTDTNNGDGNDDGDDDGDNGGDADNGEDVMENGDTDIDTAPTVTSYGGEEEGDIAQSGNEPNYETSDNADLDASPYGNVDAVAVLEVGYNGDDENDADPDADTNSDKKKKKPKRKKKKSKKKKKNKKRKSNKRKKSNRKPTRAPETDDDNGNEGEEETNPTSSNGQNGSPSEDNNGELSSTSSVVEETPRRGVLNCIVLRKPIEEPQASARRR